MLKVSLDIGIHIHIHHRGARRLVSGRQEVLQGHLGVALEPGPLLGLQLAQRLAALQQRQPLFLLERRLVIHIVVLPAPIIHLIIVRVRAHIPVPVPVPVRAPVLQQHV